MSESRLREEMVEFGAMLTGLGLAHGSTGNISVRLDDGWLITPTNSRMGRLDPARIARLDQDGRHVAGDTAGWHGGGRYATATPVVRPAVSVRWSSIWASVVARLRSRPVARRGATG
jgi:ribulose-5-phosphate 4-epimerase/fuculose-1-phosphate aldolase